MKSRRCTLSAACVIALIVALLSSCSATNKFEDCVAAGNYADAISVYQEKIYGNTEKEREAQDFLWTYVSSALTDFAEGKMDLTDTKAAFSTVSKINNELSILGADFNYLYGELDVVQTSKENFEKAVTLSNSEDYNAAIELFLMVDERDSENYEKAKEQADLCAKQICQKADAQIDQHIASKEYDLAIGVYDQLVQNYDNYITDELIQKIERCKASIYQIANSKIDQYIADGAYDLAIETYNDFSLHYKDLSSDEMAQKAEFCHNELIKAAVDASIEKYLSAGTVEALGLIRELLSAFPNDAKLEALRDLISTTIPVSYRDVEFKEGWFCSTGNFSIADSYGNEHVGELITLAVPSGWDAPSAAKLEFFPYEQFTNFSGKVFIGQMDSSSSVRMQIYCDDILSYDTGSLGQKWRSDEFSLDISNVYCVSIRVTGTGASVFNNPRIIIEDASFSRVLTEEMLRAAIQ